MPAVVFESHQIHFAALEKETRSRKNITLNEILHDFYLLKKCSRKPRKTLIQLENHMFLKIEKKM
jgi:hypothetical protein